MKKKKPTKRDIFQQEVKDWLAIMGWFDDTLELDLVLAAHQLDNAPFKPQLLVTKNPTALLVYLFKKGDCPTWKSMEGKVTGFDFWKYEFMKHIEGITKIPSAVVMDIETEPELIFSQLLHLGKPKVCFRDRKSGLARYYKDAEKGMNAFVFWRQEPRLFANTIKPKYPLPGETKVRKPREMAMWRRDKFRNTSIMQPIMI